MTFSTTDSTGVLNQSDWFSPTLRSRCSSIGSYVVIEHDKEPLSTGAAGEELEAGIDRTGDALTNAITQMNVLLQSARIQLSAPSSIKGDRPTHEEHMEQFNNRVVDRRIENMARQLQDAESRGQRTFTDIMSVIGSDWNREPSDDQGRNQPAPSVRSDSARERKSKELEKGGGMETSKRKHRSHIPRPSTPMLPYPGGWRFRLAADGELRW